MADENDIDRRNAQLYDAIFKGYVVAAHVDYDHEGAVEQVSEYALTDAGLECARRRCDAHNLDYDELIDQEDYATLLALVTYDDPLMIEKAPDDR